MYKKMKVKLKYPTKNTHTYLGMCIFLKYKYKIQEYIVNNIQPYTKKSKYNHNEKLFNKVYHNENIINHTNIFFKINNSGK